MSAFQEATEMSIKTTRNLEKAGMPRPQAEAVARAIAEMITAATKNLVTKDYFAREMARMETRMIKMQLWTTAFLASLITIFEFLG